MEALKIAVCDDVDIERELLEKYAREWAVCRNRRVSVSSFSCGKDLLGSFGECGFDLVLLDIQMQGQDGMCVARRIRDITQDAGIFFVTGYDEYLAEGYEVEAFRYLLKPVKKEKLWEAFDKFTARMEKKPRFWTLETPQGQRNVVLEDILYLESFGHTCRLYLAEDSFPVKMGITEIEKQLTALGLSVFRTHRSYLVNMARVTAVEREAAVLADGRRIPVSRRLYHSLNHAFIRYFRMEP